MSYALYPPWWDANVTLYNRFEGPNGAVTWYKTQLSGCWYSTGKNTQTSRTYDADKRDANDFICRIRESVAYRSPDVWAALDDEGKAASFTVCPGDILVPAFVADEIDESGKAGPRSSELLEKYFLLGAFRVSSAKDNTGTGVGSPHYRASGVI